MIFVPQQLFTFLLRSAASVPPPIAHILVALLLAGLVQTVAQSLLQHTGFFREIARIGIAIAAAMVAATVVSVLAKFDIVGFLTAYTVVFASGVLYYIVAIVRGPIRAATLDPAA